MCCEIRSCNLFLIEFFVSGVVIRLIPEESKSAAQLNANGGAHLSYRRWYDVTVPAYKEFIT